MIKMETIKLRAWDKENKVMIYDFDQPNDVWEKVYNLLPGDNLHNTVWRVGLHYNTQMLYTGFKDINGKEIYKGDIVKNGGRIDKVVYGKFYYEGGYESIGFHLVPGERDDYCFEWDCVEVIGNIYENPELINR